MSALPTYGERAYEGKAKIVFRRPDGTLAHYFKDSATAFNAQKKSEFEGKGLLNCTISCLLLDYLNQKGIPTHWLSKIDERTFRSKSLQMLPVEVVLRNRLAGSLAKRLQEAEGRELNPPVIEFYLKDDAKGDPLVSEDVLIALYRQKAADLETCRKIILDVNRHLTKLFAQGGLILVDFKLEFGRDESGTILVADEISPDTSRLWDASTGEKYDKDRFRFDLGDLLVGYRQVLERLLKSLGMEKSG